MPRDLKDVLHYFIPEAAPPSEAADAESASETRDGAAPEEEAFGLTSLRAAALPMVAIPIGDRDVVRAAFTWNLAVEVARLGGRAVVVRTGEIDTSPIWPEAGVGPMGAELIPTLASDLGSLYRAAADLSVQRADGAGGGGLVFVRVPPEWLEKASDGGALLRWALLFSSPEPDDLKHAWGLAQKLVGAASDARVGITIHGAMGREEAEQAFAKLAHAGQKCLGVDLLSYGLLVDDLDVYRAIVAGRPIGLAHPQSPAARALRDVAQMLLGDARKLDGV